MTPTRVGLTGVPDWAHQPFGVDVEWATSTSSTWNALSLCHRGSNHFIHLLYLDGAAYYIILATSDISLMVITYTETS